MKKKLLYNQYLNTISNIYFTYREIDVIACVLHNRGEKKIASLLNVSPRTVGTHIRNILQKLAKGTRE
jgi:DNA-binding CsgD family transcriptional regulator